MRVAIAAGGSGGHLFPGIALAEELRARCSDTDVFFIGNADGIEAQVAPSEGYPIRFIKASGFLGKSAMGKLSSLIGHMKAASDARALYREARPDVVVGAGGYVSVGPAIAAWSMGIPLVIMEQNCVPGLANRLLARVARAVAITYRESAAYFPRHKVHRTGNPIRSSMLKGSRAKGLELFSLASDRLTVCVIGGSSGARRINEAVLASLEGMFDMRDKVQFLHQTGKQDYDHVRSMYRHMGFMAMAAPFISQMAEAYAVADIVVTRAGATSLAELTAIGKPMLLVPYPHAEGHQEFNARKIEEAGGGRIIRDRDLSGPVLAGRLRELVESDEARNEMRKRAATLGKPDAAARAADLVEAVARTGR